MDEISSPAVHNAERSRLRKRGHQSGSCLCAGAGHLDQKVFYEAFGIFDNQSIEKSLVSENPLVRIFALLDRRLGKRRLLALEESMEQELDWVRAFYVIRMQAEGLMEGKKHLQ